MKSSTRREEALISSSYRAGKQGYLSLVTSAATMILGGFNQALSSSRLKLRAKTPWNFRFSDAIDSRPKPQTQETAAPIAR